MMIFIRPTWILSLLPQIQKNNIKVAEIEATWEKMKQLAAEKKKTIQAEFVRFDQKCQEYATAANAFVEFLEAQRKELDGLQGEPVPLSASIQEFYDEGKKIKVKKKNPFFKHMITTFKKAKLEEVSVLSQSLASMKITENPHTGITLQGLQTKVREFDVYVKQYLNELADEEEIKTNYANGAQAYVDWLENTLPKLNER